MTSTETIARRGDTIILATLQGPTPVVVTRVEVHQSRYSENKFRRYNVREVETGKVYNIGINRGDVVVPLA